MILKKSNRKLGIATTVGTVIFLLVSLIVFSAFSAMELQSTSNAEDGLAAQNILAGKNQEILTALFNQQNQQVMVNNNGSISSGIIALVSIDSSGDLHFCSQCNLPLVLSPGNSATVCSSSCNSYTGILTSLGNVFTITNTEDYGFDISLSNSSSYTLQGGTNATTIVLRSLGGYNHQVMLYVPDQPVGVNVSFIPQIFTPTSSGAEGAMIIKVSSTAIQQEYSLNVDAQGSDGAANSTVYTLTIVS